MENLLKSQASGKKIIERTPILGSLPCPRHRTICQDSDMKEAFAERRTDFGAVYEIGDRPRSRTFSELVVAYSRQRLI